MIPSLRKWAFLVVTAAALAVIGCGGTSSSSGNGGTSTSSGSSAGNTTTTGSYQTGAATVNLGSSYGLVYLGFLTGSSRTAGDLYMNIEHLLLNDSNNNISIPNGQVSPIRLHLSGYSFQMATIDVPQSGFNSELFDTTTIVPYSFALEQSNGYVGLNPGDSGYLGVLQASDPPVSGFGGLYPAVTIQPQTRLRTFPGRDTALPLFFDQTMFATDPTGAYAGLVPDPSVAFATNGVGQTLFQDANEPTNNYDFTTSGKAAAHISDMVQFSLASIPASQKPTLTAAKGQAKGSIATHFYVSGDTYALSDDNGSAPGNFQELTTYQGQPIFGKMGQPGSVLSSGFQFGGFPGTYDLTQVNPTDLFNKLAPITSLFGRWRPINNVMNLTQTSFDIIIFPNSNESYTYNSPADVVAIAHSGNTITSIYAGAAYYHGGLGKNPAVAQLYPLSNFVNASTANEVDFALGNFVGPGGTPTQDDPTVRNGTFTYLKGTLPSGFSSSGHFVVFRQ